MKKKIFGGIAILAFTAVVGLNVKMNADKNQINDLALANVEALASSEDEKIISVSRVIVDALDPVIAPMPGGGILYCEVTQLTCEGTGRLQCVSGVYSDCVAVGPTE